MHNWTGNYNYLWQLSRFTIYSINKISDLIYQIYMISYMSIKISYVLYI